MARLGRWGFPVRVADELRAYEAAGSLAEELPYWGWLDDGRTCLTRSGELVAVGRVRSRRDRREDTRTDRPRAGTLAEVALGSRSRHAASVPHAPASQPHRESAGQRFGHRVLVGAQPKRVPRRTCAAPQRIRRLVSGSRPALRRRGFAAGTAIAAHPLAEATAERRADLLGLGDRGGRRPVPGDDRRGPLARGRTHARRAARSARGVRAPFRVDEQARHVLGRCDGQRHELAARDLGAGGRAFASDARRRAGDPLLAPLTAGAGAREPAPRPLLPGRGDDGLARMAAVDYRNGSPPDPGARSATTSRGATR